MADEQNDPPDDAEPDEVLDAGSDADPVDASATDPVIDAEDAGSTAEEAAVDKKAVAKRGATKKAAAKKPAPASEAAPGKSTPGGSDSDGAEAGDQGSGGQATTNAAGTAVRKKVTSKRVTPKGTTQGTKVTSSPVPSKTRSATTDDDDDEPSFSKRYTPPQATYAQGPSPMWVPILMFGLLIVGALVIMLNYMEVFGAPANIRLVIGLAFILGGIITATQYR